MSETVFHGDNLPLMQSLVDGKLAARLIYIDPPFFTGRDFYKNKELAFTDKWPNLKTYLDHLRPRFEVAHKLLTPDGCLVVHVDNDVSYDIKPILDEIFGRECFASEIIWRYRRWPAKTPNFQSVHDVLLRYVRDSKVTPHWNQLYEPLAPSTLKTFGNGKQKAEVVDGKRVRSTVTTETSLGVPMGDVWDIGIIAPIAKERTGYPTQKPEALLERLISATTSPGDLIVDPYCGSGTSGVVAKKLGREWIGFDSSEVAVKTAQARLDS